MTDVTIRSRSSSARSRTASSCRRRTRRCCEETIRRTRPLADENARRLGMSRRQFLGERDRRGRRCSSCSPRARTRRRRARASRRAAPSTSRRRRRSTAAAALDAVGGEEFIFDVQTHYVNYDLAAAGGEWTSVFPFASCAEGDAAGNSKACFTADAYFREMFVRSDTSMSILSALPTPSGTRPVGRRHGVRDRRRDADRLRRPRADARRRVPAPRPDRGRARGHDRPARHATTSRRGRSTRWCRPTRTSTSTTTTRPGRRSASGSSTTCARSGRRSSARTRASRRSSARHPSSPTRATSARPRRGIPTSRSSSTTPASSRTRAARVRTTRTTRHPRASTG